MKKMGFGLVLMALSQVVLATDIVLLTDDFEDNSIDSSKWTLITATGHESFDESSAGGVVTEQSGYIWIQDAMGAFKSKLLPVNDLGEMTITRNIYVSKGSGTLVSRPDEIVAEDGTVLLRWGYHNYSDGGTNRYGFGGFYDTLVTATWDSFFDETITYDPVSGEGSYSNANGTATIAGTPLPAGTTNIYLRSSAYAVGSSSDYKALEDFSITQVDFKQLTVDSTYGSPSPDRGDSMHPAGSVVNCSVTNVVATGGWGTPVIRYGCTGWTGTGSVPVSGATNEVAVTLNEDSSIIWNWEALDAVLTVSSFAGSPSPSVGSTSYAIGSEVTCSVQNEVTVDGIRYQCSGWTGTGSVPSSGTSNSVVVSIGETSSITWTWQNLDSELTVVSAYGDPTPPVGEAIYLAGTVVSSSVDHVISSSTQHLCTGWWLDRIYSGGGSYRIGSGTNNQSNFTLDYSGYRLTWLWETDYWLNIQIEGSGTVSQVSGFYDDGSVQTLTATPADGWVFDGWSGDASGTGNASLTMSEPRSVIATFSIPASIENLSVAQVEGERTVELSYDVAGTRSLLVDVEVYQGGSNLNVSALSGAVGMVGSGTNKVVSWNAGSDWNLNVGELTFKLLTEDGLPFYAPYLGGAVSIPRTGQTNSYSAYLVEDGDVRPGMEWPQPRFTDNGDGTVTDHMTGLMWSTSYSSAYWGTAMQNCDNSTLAGHDDWRLPNIRELRSLLSDFSRYSPVSELNIPPAGFWTSTRYEEDPNYAYALNAYNGTVYPSQISKSLSNPPYIQYYSAYYMPVRGSSTGAVRVAKTGQITSFTTQYENEDGDLQLGEAWPQPRFTNHGDGTATDNLTGLMWTTNTLGHQNWSAALAICQSLTTGGYDDWRLPSVLELESLVDFGKTGPDVLLPDGHPFSGVVRSSSYDSHYWTGTTFPGNSGEAYKVSFQNGQTYAYTKGGPGAIFVCRGGAEIQETIADPSTYEPLPVTGQTNSFAVGDDGDLQKGVTNPNPYASRFTHSGSGRYLDTRTGLEWYVSDGYNTYWSSAINNCESADVGGATDWRLPNVREMLSLLDYGQSTPMLPEGHPFADWTNTVYWASTLSPHDTDYALTVNLNNGAVSVGHRGVSEYCFCLVRWITEPSDIAAVPKTGQILSLVTGDDGYYQKGVTVSGERFVDNGNGTVNDSQTGLMWLKDAGAIGRTEWSNAVEVCESMHFGSYSDWRLPNARELESLVSYSTNSPPVSPDVFDNVKFTQDAAYWTSTTFAEDSDQAVECHFDTACQYPQYKTNSRYVWPVRSGN